MTADEFKAFLTAARDNKVQEFSIGDTHVLFSPAALVTLPIDANEPEKKLASEPLSEDEKIVAKLMDDPDLFLSSDGPPVVPQ